MYAQANARAGQAEAIDEGLRAYMLRIYNLMALGVAITGIAALGTVMLAVQNGQLTAFGQAIYASPLQWVIMLAPLAVVFIFSARIHAMSAGTAQAVFFGFAALMGMSLSSIFLVFTGESIVQVFFITAAAFGALSLWGYTTKRDISGWGSFLFMGLIGIIIASIVNIFLQSSMMGFVVSVIGVLVFAGLTAWDTQRLKNMYYQFAGDSAVLGQIAISGALSLYLNFINLFIMLLQLFGNRE
ncbi:MAG: Bax inhibitor-1/YccA family protein [Pseudomonadota bacterium]